MANYIIIGGDNKEYGPVSDADLRSWISEGRLNGESRVKAESDAEFRALALFPEFAAALGERANPPTIGPVTGAPARTPEDFLNRDYELDIGGCLSRGWEVYKENFGIIFGTFIIMFLVNMACGVALGVMTAPFAKHLLQAPVGVRVAYNFGISVVVQLLAGPMLGGLYMVYLKVIRKQPTGVGELFAGFQAAGGRLALGGIIVSAVMNACMLPAQFVWQTKWGPLQEQMQSAQSDPGAMQHFLPQLMDAFAHAAPVFFICMVPATFFTVGLQFTLPLIIDKQMSLGAALKTSWTMVLRHFWQMLGLFILAGLVSFLGIFGCIVGVLFTAPIAMTAIMFAYETVFGDQRD